MAADDREPERTFKVQDRRRFSASGEAREDAEVAADAPPAAPQSAASAPPPPPETAPPPALTFSTFLMSLVTQALALLGEIPNPMDGRTSVELDAARQMIDILGILDEKTRGNLDAGEAALLEGALYDLRMKYVERANAR
ncbi:MAG: DUF1844 domain-containing protein [Deltaproteobacteria bacterium]|nr:DUF1844 domain-containing protein [Deltaproteobacteria bacterium]